MTAGSILDDSWFLDAMAMPGGAATDDVGYLPRPNRVEAVVTALAAPPDLVRTAFLLPFLPDGSLVMAVNRRRGPEIPGGHIEEGEDALEAAVREAFEETGVIVERPSPLGYLRMVSRGEAPTGWGYPHPVGFQQFFAARVLRVETRDADDECLEPLLVTREMAADPGGPLDPVQAEFHAAGHRLVFGFSAGTLPPADAEAPSPAP